MEAMKKALDKRRGKGLDVTIMMGGKPSDGDDKTTDKAPDLGMPAPGMEGGGMDDDTLPQGDELDQLKSLIKDNPKATALLASLEAKHAPAPDAPTDDGDAGDDMMQGMSDHEKADMASRPPRGLHERAMQAMMKGKK